MNFSMKENWSLYFLLPTTEESSTMLAPYCASMIDSNVNSRFLRLNEFNNFCAFIISKKSTIFEINVKMVSNK